MGKRKEDTEGTVSSAAKDRAQRREEKKEDRRVRRTRRLLYKAMTELLAKKKSKEITVQELTELADMNRGTFYFYYRDIPDLMEKMEDELFESMDALFLQREGEMAEETLPLLSDLFRCIQENKDLCRVLLSPNGDMNFLHRLNTVVREKCLAAWETEWGSDRPGFEYHYSFLVFGCAGILRAWLNGDCRESPEEMARMTDAMFRRGGLALSGESADRR